MPAAVLAVAYLAAALVLTVAGVLGDDLTLLWRMVTLDVFREGDPVRPQPVLIAALLLVATVQAWVYRQVLRGRPRGEPARHGRAAGPLRVTLYLAAAATPASYVLLLLWATSDVIVVAFLVLGVATALNQLALTWLLFRVLAVTTGPPLRLLVLVTGVLCGAYGLLTTFLDTLGPLERAGALPSLVWIATIVAAQARDPRWSAATVWTGVAVLAITLLRPTSFAYFGPAGQVPPGLVVFYLFNGLSVVGMAWYAGSAHDLGTVRPPAGPRREPVRAPARWWPLPAVAVLLPLLPAAVNLSRGMPFWNGPGNGVHASVMEFTGWEFTLVWFALDVLVGVGAPAVLVAVAVLRRTRRLLRFAVGSLLAVAVLGLLSALTPIKETGLPPGEDVPLYPDGLFVAGGTFSRGGLSPLWFSLALTGSAVLLLLLYAAPPAPRTARRTVAAALTCGAALLLLPAASQEPGRVTAAETCLPPEDDVGEPPRLTAEQAFVCAMRGEQPGAGLRRFAATTPDHMVLAYGRRLCGAYTRDDPEELARLKVDRAALTSVIAGICPGAASAVAASRARQDREYAEMKAEMDAEAQRMCDATPRHKPRITPARATRVKKPQWTGYGVLEATEGTGGDHLGDDLLTEAQDNGLAAAHAGHLIVLTHSDSDLCVTVETYRRRPPVETEGWDHVVEVGYDSRGGAIVLGDTISGTKLPDLALDGRAGHYRIRVHHAWFPWEKAVMGEGQRLLIMAYPGRGDEVVTYRAPR